MRTSNNLDVLRAIAVLYVVLDHSLKFFGHAALFGVDVQWVGKLGVMFFFVHTCMVLMLSLERSEHRFSTSQSVGNFYLRRIFRIYPLSVFAIAIVLMFSIPAEKIQGSFNISQFSPTRGELIQNLLLVQNHSGARSIIAVLWSLPFEVQMYLFLPFVFLFIAKKGRLAWLFAIWALGLTTEYLLRPHAMFVAHFIPGVIAYVVLKRMGKPRIPGWAWPIFIGILTAAFLALSPSFLMGAFACLFLGVALPQFRDFGFTPVNFTAHNVAKYSYGVYLSHMFCLWFAFIHWRSEPMVLQAFIFAGCLIGVPVVLFHLIEDPMVRAGSRLADFLFAKRSRWRKSALGLRAEDLEETASGL